MIPDTIGNETRAGHVQRQIRWAQEEEARLLLHGDRKDPVYLPFMPYQISDFTAVMIDCVAETHGPEFLDVGCGTGTKMVLAHELFGLEVSGIERDHEMWKTAQNRGTAIFGDALNPLLNYGLYDIIWLYRPFRDNDLEASLEGKIFTEMKSGAIVAGGAWEICPAALGWNTIVDDWELRRGAWMKP